ncbi:DUF5994 family protein [Nocardioides speluncae]|uniref:DUF5994 family protein n=1 Tax=Nocardioides speluncae TaxID=2670337 RepID=UPI000D689F25|nr:DUF5994 family protein [Nocardioides speluncae]
MGGPKFPYPHRYPQPLGALRLRLAPASGNAAHGVWWPYSRDLTREAAHLVDDFPPARGKVDRMVYSPDDWEVVADEVHTNRGRIKVGFLPPEHPGGVVLLRLVGSEIVQLRVAWVAPRMPIA